MYYEIRSSGLLAIKLIRIQKAIFYSDNVKDQVVDSKI